jgi:hypothetical protein
MGRAGRYIFLRTNDSLGLWAPDRARPLRRCASRHACPGRTVVIRATASSRRLAPEFCCGCHPRIRRGRRECRVLAATHGPPAVKKAGGSHHRSSRIIRHSLRDGFNDFLRALPGDRAFLPPSRADRTARLTPASGRQDHTTSSSASAPFVRTTSSCASLPRPSHPASRVVTIAHTPLLPRRDGADETPDLG